MKQTPTALPARSSCWQPECTFSLNSQIVKKGAGRFPVPRKPVSAEVVGPRGSGSGDENAQLPWESFWTPPSFVGLAHLRVSLHHTQAYRRH